MFYINQRVCWNEMESGVGVRSLIDAVVTYFRVHGIEEYRKIQLSCLVAWPFFERLVFFNIL
jgi:hypothetical protein